MSQAEIKHAASATKEELLAIAKGIWAEVLSTEARDDETLSMFAQKYVDFAHSFYVVLVFMVRERKFYSSVFMTYVDEYRPMFSTRRDLYEYMALYPVLIYKHEVPHFNPKHAADIRRACVESIEQEQAALEEAHRKGEIQAKIDEERIRKQKIADMKNRLGYPTDALDTTDRPSDGT